MDGSASDLFRIGVDRNAAALAQRELNRRVEAHTGRKTGSWEASCSTYTTAEKFQRASVVVVWLSDLPDSNFVLSGRSITRTDTNFPALLERATLHKLRTTRVARGVVYSLADFQIRVGLVYEKSAPTRAVVEVEYAPYSHVSSCVPLAMELMERIAAPLVAVPDTGRDAGANTAASTTFSFTLVTEEFSKFLPDETYNDSHTALLYHKLLTSPN